MQSALSLRDLGLSDLKASQFKELVNRLLPGYSAENKVSSQWHTSYVSAESFFENKHGMFQSGVLVSIGKSWITEVNVIFFSSKLISHVLDNVVKEKIFSKKSLNVPYYCIEALWSCAVRSWELEKIQLRFLNCFFKFIFEVDCY